MSFTAEQLEERRGGIGGSEIAAILGENPYFGALDVYLSKVEGYQRPVTSDMERGLFLEDGIARWYAHRQGVQLDSCGTVWHAARPRAFCTPDRLAFVNGRERLISIKAPAVAGDEWGEPGTGKVPLYAVLQLQQEDAVLTSLGKSLDPVSHLVALLGGDLRVYPIERDEELQQWLLDAGAAWFERHILGREAPALDGSEGARAWLRRRFPRNTLPMIRASAQDELLLYALKTAEAKEATATSEYEIARQRVEERIGEAEGIEGALGRITWRADKNLKRSFRTKWSATT